MIPNPTLYRMLAQAQYEDMLRKAEQRRLQACPPRPRRNTSGRTACRLGAWLKPFGQPSTAFKHHF